ncbi:HlyD family efflux transporter periplasmic adaptor subunit [uncultured Pseudodesulfovibrio sp.]|uniref:efflux RND transporter periplasmic adaptor subunit n=1 Tax=uncultured Pseudodesulfovibrio sp. TaxID=2035858 RepID=UPI0029C68CB4|nr:HlyD family efflux transporter periplasmic adaptor subunit [uncultured Pseudodesulfovibrio sp.]
MKRNSLWLYLLIVLWCLLVAPALAENRSAVGTGAASLEGAHQGKIYCSQVYFVSSSYNGEVSEKMVEVAQFVEKGDPILKIALTDAVWNQLNASIDMDMGILNSKVSIAALKQKIKDTETQKSEQKRLASEGMAAAKSIEQLEDQLALMKLQSVQAERGLENIYKNLKRQRQFLSKSLGQKVVNRVPRFYIVKAPMSGHVIWENTNTGVGSWAAGHLFTIGVMDPMIIRTRMYEADVMNLKIGDEAEVLLEYGADRVLKAMIKSIGWMPVNQSIDAPSYYTVELEIPNPDAALREGYMVRVMFPKKP